MHNNPYAPPKAAVADRGTVDRRPFEITVLAGAAVWGFLSNTIPYLVPGYLERQIRVVGLSGMPTALFVGDMVVFVCLWAVTSAGLWWRRPEGWWCAAFLYQTSILRYARSLLLNVNVGAPIRPSHIVTLIGFIVQCWLLYRNNPRTWTGVSSWPLRWLILFPFVAMMPYSALVTVLQVLLRR